MRLKKVHVKNYRSIEDSQEFEVGGVTCLVGKNEAGKTAVLQALNTLRPYNAPEAQYDKVRDYPRRFLNHYDERHAEDHAMAADTHWEMSDEDRKELESEFGPGFVAGNDVRLTSGYDGETHWSFDADEKAAVQHLISEFNLDATEQAGIKHCVSTEDAHRILSEKEDCTEKQSRLMAKIAQYKERSAQKEAVKILDRITPRFLYFSHFDRMNGQASIEKLRADKKKKTIEEGDQVFLDFLAYAGINVDDIDSATTYENLNSLCESASNKITDQLMSYWRQNRHLEVEIRLTRAEPDDPEPFNKGTIARARIKNVLHKVSVPFSERSAGFIWFFSFLIKFTQVRKEFGNVIILLDEPGLTLHGKAQQDLLRYIEEKLEPKHQIIFSTHSPFMVPVNRMEDVRLVEDVIEQKGTEKPLIHGTRVSADFTARDPDTLFPLRSALGYDLAHNLFAGHHNLVVGGLSDFTYLTLLSDRLQKKGRTGLDEKWSIVPTGGADMVATFSALAGGPLDVTVLSDSQKGGHRRLMTLVNHGLLESRRIINVGDVFKWPVADIEDLFSSGDFLALCNLAFPGKMRAKDFTGTGPVVEIVARQAGEDEFDRRKPADILLRRHNRLVPRLKRETLNNFEALFKMINATLRD